ncbi:MAG: acetate--CoA ligase family protein [Actinomycetota bacterium]
METDLKHFFHPRTIAVIGATDDKSRPGYHLLKKVIARSARDGGTVYGVNPRLQQVEGVACYPTLNDVPGELDVVVVMINDAERGVRDAVARKARFAIVFTAGFREVGAEGATREEALAKIARDGGVRLFGPNTNVNAFELFPDLEGPKVGLITQSGHQGRPIAQGVELNIPIKYWAPTGNEADLEFADFVEFFVDDPEIAVIAAYIEGFKSIPRLRQAAEKAARAGKPIVLVKVGRTEAGQKMAMAHTGHLTGSDAVHDAFFKQYGIVRVDDLDELLDTAAMFTRLRKPSGDGIGIYAISGGTGAHMADLCAWGGLKLPTLEQKTQEKLRTLIPDYLTVSNPVDNGAQAVRKPGQNKMLIETVLEDPNIDLLLCPITGILPSMSKIVTGDIVDAYRSASKGIVAIWGSPVTDEDGFRSLVAGQVPMFRSFRACVAGLRRYLDYWSFQTSFEPRSVSSNVGPLGKERMPLSELESAQIAARYSIAFPQTELVSSSESAEKAARSFGERVVLKACGSSILHKSDAGLVKVGVAIDGVRKAFEDLDSKARTMTGGEGYDGILVQEMIDGGEEVIAGATRDPQFGPVVLFGLGGIFAEVLKDVSLRVAPLTQDDAMGMIRQIKGFPLLDGARGRPKADVDALVELLMNVSSMALELDDVLEIDLNPVLAKPAGQGVIALDALIVRSAAST